MMLFSHPGFHCVAAEVDGQIVGSVCQDERSTIAGFGPLSIAPDAQDRGIGRFLAQSMIDRAKERGLSGVRLLQATFHNRSLSLYAKLGFTAREPLSVMAGLSLKQRARPTQHHYRCYRWVNLSSSSVCSEENQKENHWGSSAAC
jgi:predicted N-acetyltransferase YhbS